MNEHSLLGVLAESGINIHRAAFVRLDSSWNFETSGSVFSRLYFVNSGEGFIKTENEDITLRPGYVYFIPPSARFSCGCEHMEKTFFHISFPTVEKYDFFEKSDRVCELPYPIEKQEKIASLLESENYLDIIKIKLLISEVVLDFCRAFPVGEGRIKKHSPLVEKIISYIDANLSVKLTTSDIAKSLFLSESKIRNAFKAEIGIPLGKYIDDMVFIKARQLLVDSERSISAVSAELGFCDQFYFSRRFSERFGRSPKSFKSENKIT